MPLIIKPIEQLIRHIKTFYLLSPEAEEAVHSCFEAVELPRNAYLVKEGRVCRQLYFLEQGALRGYYRVDGKEITHWFGFEGDFVTSFHSFITQQPSVENIQLLEDAVLWSISREKLQRLQDSFHEIERVVRIAYERYYIRLEERYVNAHFKTAAVRYRDLLEQSPHILERVPLGTIASYLGISQETLSRIRSRL